MKPEHFKPFNAEHAKAGAPYGCRNGQEAAVMKWDGRNPSYPLVGCFGGHDESARWTGEGRYISHHAESVLDLVMLPLGYIDDKPVFVGDEIESENDGRKHVAYPEQRNFGGARWPEPAKQYPVTGMTQEDLDHVWCTAKGNSSTAMRAVANAALRHACESGQVVPMADVQEVVRNLAAKDRAARDLAVAEAIRREAVRIACAYNNATLIYNAIDRADLLPIIAKIPA